MVVYMNSQNEKVKTMTIAGLLCALGILIPMFAPKLVLEPASFTLASHVPVFISMFISVPVAISVALITGFGFLFAGYPIIVVLRALTHLIFATIGAYILSKHKNILNNRKTAFLFSLSIGIIHAIGEIIVVTLFYWGGSITELYYQQGYLISVLVLVGIGTVVHSMIDLGIAIFVWKPIQKVIPVSANVRLKNII